MLCRSERTDPALYTWLASLGTEPTFRPETGVLISVAAYPKVAASGVAISRDPELEALHLLTIYPPGPGEKAEIIVDPDGTLILNWDSRGTEHCEPVSTDSVAALVAAEAPLIAGEQVWQRLETDSTSLTLRITARAQLAGVGYIELSSSKPQLIETLPLPGLFRTGTGTYGLSVAAAEHLKQVPGIAWAGNRPRTGAPNRHNTPRVQVSQHISGDLDELVQGLSDTGGRVVIWESGLGRRLYCLLALDQLDAYPATIVTTPAGVWAWRRHADVLGRLASISGTDTDIQIVTWRDLARKRPEPQAFIFDDVDSDEAAAGWEAGRALERFRDALRIGVLGTWPEDEQSQLRIMNLVRPGEFRADWSVPERYPADSYHRFNEHVGLYLSWRTVADTPQQAMFKRSTIRTVTLPDTIQEETRRRLADDRDSYDLLATVMELATVGPAHTISPKLAVAADLARAQAMGGRKVAVLTRFRRAAALLRTLTRPLPGRIVDGGEETLDTIEDGVTIHLFDRRPPSVTGYDLVVVLDYPWSTTLLDRAVGAASAADGPDVTVIHAVGTVDDRLAMLAARRSELSPVADPDRPLEGHEVDFLLAART